MTIRRIRTHTTRPGALDRIAQGLFKCCVPLTIAALAFSTVPVKAEIVVKIGVLNDRSGVYSDLTGEGSVVAARLAVEDFQPLRHGMTVEIVAADHQNKPDIGATIARRWIDIDGVDVIADVPTSSVTLAVNEVVREKKKILLASGGATSELTGKACSPYTVQWTYDSWSLISNLAKKVVQSGDRTWFFITADYAWGTSAEADATAAILKAGGQIVGSIRTPFPTSDFSSYLLQAQQSGAKVIGLANAGADTVNSIKQASEFGISQGPQKILASLLLVNDVHALGLHTAQGIEFVAASYWDLNEATRAFAARFAIQRGGAMPNEAQMGVYSSVLHYLRAVASEKDKQSDAVMRRMKATPIDDPLFGKGQVREDGRATHPMYLMRVKSPQESASAWDLFRIERVIPADEAFRPLNDGGCPLVSK